MFEVCAEVGGDAVDGDAGEGYGFDAGAVEGDGFEIAFDEGDESAGDFVVVGFDGEWCG